MDWRGSRDRLEGVAGSLGGGRGIAWRGSRDRLLSLSNTEKNISEKNTEMNTEKNTEKNSSNLFTLKIASVG
jgi:hypothetical protein